MEIILAASFKRSLRFFSKDARRLYEVQAQRFKIDWHDPRLHIKKLKGLEHAFSFRVTRRYRVLFYFRDARAVVFFDIDHRKDVYA